MIASVLIAIAGALVAAVIYDSLPRLALAMAWAATRLTPGPLRDDVDFYADVSVSLKDIPSGVETKFSVVFRMASGSLFLAAPRLWVLGMSVKAEVAFLQRRFVLGRPKKILLRVQHTTVSLGCCQCRSSMASGDELRGSCGRLEGYRGSVQKPSEDCWPVDFERGEQLALLPPLGRRGPHSLCVVMAKWRRAEMATAPMSGLWNRRSTVNSTFDVSDVGPF